MRGKKILIAVAVGMLLFWGAQTTMPAEAAGVECIEESGQEEMLLGQEVTEEIEDQVVPLAVLSAEKDTHEFSWRGLLLVVLALSIVGTGIWAIFKSRDEKRKPE